MSWKDLFPKENRYFETENGVLYCNEAVEQLKRIPSESIDLVDEHDVVLDPMCGSGTTLKMAEKLGRRWIGIEIEEKYCEIAKQRIESLLNINTRVENE